MGERSQASRQLDIGQKKKTARSGEKAHRHKRTLMKFTSHQQYQFSREAKQEKDKEAEEKKVRQ